MHLTQPGGCPMQGSASLAIRMWDQFSPLLHQLGRLAWGEANSGGLAAALITQAVTCARVLKSSLAKILATCLAAVDWLMNSLCPIARFDRPSATSLATSHSRSVSGPGQAGGCKPRPRPGLRPGRGPWAGALAAAPAEACSCPLIPPGWLAGTACWAGTP